MGVRHALDADHLAAVATLATRGRGVAGTVLRGAAWGVGHTVTLLVVGGTCLLMSVTIPEGLERGLELAVGVMLVVLGADVLRRMRRDRIHVHVHRHGEGLVHLHAHRHDPDEAHDVDHHDHAHPDRFATRALAVGMVHGLAGSAALLLLAVQTSQSFWFGLFYIAVFGVGSILGMAALSAAISLPLQFSARRLTRVSTGLETAIGVLTVVIGLWVIIERA